jgi:hypothetical protein
MKERGARYYHPETGRWASRDHVNEINPEHPVSVYASAAYLSEINASIGSIERAFGNSLMSSEKSRLLRETLSQIYSEKSYLEKALYSPDYANTYGFLLNSPYFYVDSHGETVIAVPVVVIYVCTAVLCYVVITHPIPIPTPKPPPPLPPHCDISTGCTGPCALTFGPYPILGNCGYVTGIAGPMKGCQICRCGP